MSQAFALILVLFSAMLSSGQDSLSRAMTRAFYGRQEAAVILDVETGTVLASHDMDRAARRSFVPVRIRFHPSRKLLT
jgi:D-alanyl-D-alanine carboxypeptidase